MAKKPSLLYRMLMGGIGGIVGYLIFKPKSSMTLGELLTKKD